MTGKKFFNLPLIFTYLVSFVLLIALVVYAAGFVKSGMNYFFPVQPPQYNEKTTDTGFVFNDEAIAYYKEYVNQENNKVNIRDLINSALKVALFLPFFFIFFFRSKKIVEENDVPFSVKNLYFYLVCATTFFIALFSASGALGNIVNNYYPVSTPPPLIEYGYRIQQPQQPVKEKPVPVQPPSDGKKITIDKAALEKAIKDQSQTAYYNNEALRYELTFVIVAIPVFFLHWSQIKRQGLPG